MEIYTIDSWREGTVGTEDALQLTGRLVENCSDETCNHVTHCAWKMEVTEEEFQRGITLGIIFEYSNQED